MPHDIQNFRNSIADISILGQFCTYLEFRGEKYLNNLEDAFKEEIKSLVELCILEEVTEHTDWVNSYVIVEKDSGNHHAPNHTITEETEDLPGS